MEMSQDEGAMAVPSRHQALMALDAELGALKVGELAIDRVALDNMGARLAGSPLSIERFNTTQAGQDFIDQVSFSASHLTDHLTRASPQLSAQATGVLFELASLRSDWAAPLLSHTESCGVQVVRLDRLLRSLQKVNLNDMRGIDSLPAWADKVKSAGVQSLGNGLQIYGFYSAIRGVGEAIRTGDSQGLLFEGGAFTAEVLSLGAELALERLGTKVMGTAHTVYRGFCASRIGLLLKRGAGLIASVITLPFDIAQAAIALSKALETQGKAAQDLYVEAGFSLASAALSTALGAAALAGFSAAGPLGLVASALLIVGAQAYAAARAVDEIDDYIQLSTLERLRTGWFAFTHQAFDQTVLDRFSTEHARRQYQEGLKVQARSLLDGELKGSVKAIVNGKFDVQIHTVRHWQYVWDEASGERPYREVREPVIRDEDDYFDGRKEGALELLPEATLEHGGQGKGVAWLLGGGRDTVWGVPSSPNFFSYSGGEKYLQGGSVDDEFIFEVPQGMFSATDGKAETSRLIGSTGTNTLSFVGERPTPEGAGFKVNLSAGTVHLITDNALNDRECMVLSDIDNVSTLAGASSVVTGNIQANRIVLNGDQDLAEGQDGDDHLSVRRGSAKVSGGPGADVYEISEHARDVIIDEDGQQRSLILLNWPASRIQRWWVAGNDLKLTCTRGRDGELPGASVTVQNVYVLRSGRRWLVNTLFSFLTADGCRLVPLLPQVLDSVGEPSVSVEVVAPPTPLISPQRVGSEQSLALGVSASHYFVSRGHGRTVINAAQSNGSSQCCLYVDYDSQELTEVVASYHVSTKRQGNFDYLNYNEAAIKFVWADGRTLHLEAYAEQPVASWTSVGGALQACALKLKCEFIMVLRDGVSFRTVPPLQSYFSDHASPGFKTLDGTASLVFRHGVFPFFKPLQAKSIHLVGPSQRLELSPAPHTVTYAITGQGGVYEVHLTSSVVIALSTPGALDKRSDASSWHIYCTGMAEDISLDSIVFEVGAIKVGSATVYVRRPRDPSIALENMSIYSNTGIRYGVRLDIEKAYVAGVVASDKSSVSTLLRLLRSARQQSAVVSSLVKIERVQMADGTPGTIYYDVVADCWRLGDDWTRQVVSSQLIISRQAHE